VRAAADKGQKSEYLTLTLKEVLVTGVNASANGGTDASTPKGVAGVSEIIELLFGALKVDAGGASSCFDSVSNSSGGLCSSNGSLAG
jgi:type VI protein secretion system component Hcp